MSKRAPTAASSRLRQDYMRIKRDPVPYITAEPLPSNILEWHYVIRGPEDSPYRGGFYHGKLLFPKEFPFQPPRIIMITPNGRFKTNTRLCLSISDYHPDTWNPAWSVSTILTGLLSFMLEKATTLGSIDTSNYQKQQYALQTLEFNLRNKTFCELFPDIRQEIEDTLKQSELEAERDRQSGNSLSNTRGIPLEEYSTSQSDNGNPLGNTIANVCVFIGFAVFALTVNYVLKAVSNNGDASHV